MREEEEDGYYCALDGEDDDFEDEEEKQVNCAVRRIMLALKQEDDLQRYQLFRTKCTILEKIFAVIIDSGA